MPGRQPQLVARDVRAGHGPDHARVDVEVTERLGEHPARPLDALGVDLLRAVRALQEAELRHPVVEVLGLRDRGAAVAHRGELGLGLWLLGRDLLGLGLDRRLEHGFGLRRHDRVLVGLLLLVQVRVAVCRVERRRLHVRGAHHRLAILWLRWLERLGLAVAARASP